MANWIEIEENNTQKKYKNSEKHQKNISEKIFKIKNNYSENKDEFKNFVSEINNMVERVNNLSIKSRWEFGNIIFKNKDTKLNNQYHSLSCSIRISKPKYIWGFIPTFKKDRFKNARVLYFYLSSENGYIIFETKDSLLRKYRITNDGEREKVRKNKSKYNTHIHKNIYKLKIEDLKKSMVLNIIDWICFKEDYETLPFKNLGTKINIKHKKNLKK